MDACLITFRSVTPAQRGESALRREGISCTVQRTPKALADQGCGYSLRLPFPQLHRATEILRQRGIIYRKTYCMQNGNPEEVRL